MRRARGLLETHCQRRVGARGLQRSIEIASFGKPGCLAVRVIKLDSSQTQSNRCGGGEAGLGNVGRVALEEDRPRLDPLHEPLSGKWPPLPDPLLHKCVEVREMEGRARVHGFDARSFSENSLPGERRLSDGALERRGRIGSWTAGILAVADQARPHLDPLPRERKLTDGALDASSRVQPNPTKSDQIQPNPIGSNRGGEDKAE